MAEPLNPSEEGAIQPGESSKLANDLLGLSDLHRHNHCQGVVAERVI